MGKACVVLRIIINKHNKNRKKETERKQQGLPFETTDLKKSVSWTQTLIMFQHYHLLVQSFYKAILLKGSNNVKNGNRLNLLRITLEALNWKGFSKFVQKYDVIIISWWKQYPLFINKDICAVCKKFGSHRISGIKNYCSGFNFAEHLIEKSMPLEINAT